MRKIVVVEIGFNGRANLIEVGKNGLIETPFLTALLFYFRLWGLHIVPLG